MMSGEPKEITCFLCEKNVCEEWRDNQRDTFEVDCKECGKYSYSLEFKEDWLIEMLGSPGKFKLNVNDNKMEEVKNYLRLLIKYREFFSSHELWEFLNKK